MIDLAPAFFKQSSSLDFHVIALIFDDIVKRSVNTIRFDVDEFFIVDTGITGTTVHLRPLRNVIVLRIIIKIQDTVFDIVCRIIFKHRRNVIVKIDPILTVKEKHPDSYQICHVFIVILPVDILVLIRLFALFSDDLLQQMPCFLGPVTIRMDACFLNIIQIVIDKILTNFLELRLQTAVAVVDGIQFFPFHSCFFQCFFFNIIFFQKVFFLDHTFSCREIPRSSRHTRPNGRPTTLL